MIISGLRISCATTVDSRPSDDSRSRCAASRWKRAIESVIVLKVEASSRASSSSQRRRRQRDLAGQVAGRRHLAHRRGDGAERARDRSRDAVAQDRGREHRDDAPSKASSAVEGAAGSRRRSVRERRMMRDRSRSAGSVAGRCRAAARAARRSPRRRAHAATGLGCRAAAPGAPAAPAAASTRYRAVHAERDVAVGQRLEAAAAIASSRLKPTLSVPRISGWSGPIEIGTVTTWRMPSGCGQKADARRARPARSAGCAHAAAVAHAPRRSARAPCPVAVGDEQEVGGELPLVLLGDRRTVGGSFGRRPPP